MQTVGQLDYNHPDIVRKGQQHFFEVGRLRRTLPGQLSRLLHLGKAVHHSGDLFTEAGLEILHCVVRVLDHIVQQGCGNRFYTQPYLHHHYLGNGYGMKYIWHSRLATDTAMRLIGKIKGVGYQLPVLRRFAYSLATFQQIVEMVLNQLIVRLSKHDNKYR